MWVPGNRPSPDPPKSEGQMGLRADAQKTGERHSTDEGLEARELDPARIECAWSFGGE
jgi:hypothetical protein